jgi:hypothetical protein
MPMIYVRICRRLFALCFSFVFGSSRSKPGSINCRSSPGLIHAF